MARDPLANAAMNWHSLQAAAQLLTGLPLTARSPVV